MLPIKGDEYEKSILGDYYFVHWGLQVIYPMEIMILLVLLEINNFNDIQK